MAAGPATIRTWDHHAASQSWQLFKSRTTAQTAVTAAKLTTPLRNVSFDEDNIEFMAVEGFDGIEVGIWGTASDNHAPVINLYEWMEDGPGHHAGTITLAFGGFTSAATTGFHAISTNPGAAHKTIRDAFAPATAYRGCDTYTETADYTGGISVPGTQETDFPATFLWSFVNSRAKYAGILVTALNSATDVGAVFRPVWLRDE